MVEAVAFDLGGTLFHGEDDVSKAKSVLYERLCERGYELDSSKFESVLREASVRFAAQYHGDYRRFHFGAFSEVFFDVWGVDTTAEERASFDRLFWQTRLRHQSLDEHAESVLRFCRRQDLVTGVITNGNRMMTETRLETAGIADEFDVVLCSTGVQAEKSTVEPFEIFLDETGLDGTDCVMVGDRIDEDTWAAEVGMTTVHLSGSSAESRGPEREPDYTIDSLDELPRVVTELL
ncbi:HAD family hydrolase [Haloferax sp. Q22]|uniref:HAD family hydrolase n=1 Tax=Haloferax sp. (strain Q22) TaxID=1526048 RepID=UPI000737CA38|nr:HAD family hydrolase [Haloferax sp. Q22]